MEEEKKEKDNSEKKKFEIDFFSILSILVMILSTGIMIFFLISFGK